MGKCEQLPYRVHREQDTVTARGFSRKASSSRGAHALALCTVAALVVAQLAGAQAFTDISASIAGVSFGSAAWGDYDNDGDLDIAIAGFNGSTWEAKIYRNKSVVANTAPAAPIGLAATPGAGSVALAWGASTDSQTSASGLTYNLRVGRTPGGVDILAPMSSTATGRRWLPALGNAQHGTSAPLRGLANGLYYWSVQAVDSAFAGSPFATEGSFVVGSCSYSLGSTGITVRSGGGSWSVDVSASSGCGWTAWTSADWINVTSGPSVVGNGTVGLSVAPNGGAERTGGVEIAGRTYTITQRAFAFLLAVSKSGSGSGAVNSAQGAIIDCGSTCSAQVVDGSLVTLSATAAQGSSFAGWHGEGCTGLGGCSVMIDQARSVQAMFVASPRSALSPIAPCRALDTRVSSGNAAAAPQLGAQSLRVFSLQGLCGLSGDADAVSVTITAVGAGALGDLQVIPSHLSSTVISSLSLPLSRARANNAIVQLSDDGQQRITVINTSSAPVHFILDISGYYRPVP
jgi:hypothetical protein